MPLPMKRQQPKQQHAKPQQRPQPQHSRPQPQHSKPQQKQQQPARQPQRKQESAEDRAMRRMQTYDESDSDLGQNGGSDNDEEDSEEDDDSEMDEDEEDSEEGDSDEDDDEDDNDEDSEEDSEEEEDSEDEAPQEVSSKPQRKIVQRRNDKNKPMEIGSKKPVGRFRQVVEVATAKRRDPRFDNLSGKLDTDLFEKSYSFLKDYQADETKKLRELIRKEKDMDLKEKMQNQLSKMVDRKATEDALKRRQEIKRDHKRKEKELVSQGKTPFFLKKSDQKKLELIDKFKHLSESPKALAKAMEKRRKRNSAKEKKQILGGNKRRRVD